MEICTISQPLALKWEEAAYIPQLLEQTDIVEMEKRIKL